MNDKNHLTNEFEFELKKLREELFCLIGTGDLLDKQSLEDKIDHFNSKLDLFMQEQVCKFAACNVATDRPGYVRVQAPGGALKANLVSGISGIGGGAASAGTLSTVTVSVPSGSLITTAAAKVGLGSAVMKTSLAAYLGGFLGVSAAAVTTGGALVAAFAAYKVVGKVARNSRRKTIKNAIRGSFDDEVAPNLRRWFQDLVNQSENGAGDHAKEQ